MTAFIAPPVVDRNVAQIPAPRGSGLDDAASLQALITAAGVGAVLEFTPGTYSLASQLVPPNAGGQIWMCYGVTFLWIGATNSVMVGNTNVAGTTFKNFRIFGLTLDAGNISGVQPLKMQSWQEGTLRDITVDRVTGGSTPALSIENNAGTTAANNSTDNLVEGLHIIVAPVGITVIGQGSGSTGNFSTNNKFVMITMDAIHVAGIRFVQWCDSDDWFGTRIALDTIGAVGVIFNDSATPLADVGVYNERFYGLGIASFGITGATGILFNASKQLYIAGAYHSPVVFNGTYLSDVAAISYDVTRLQDDNNTNNIVRSSKATVVDTSGTGVPAAYTSYITQGVTNGVDPSLVVVSTDANRAMNLKGVGTGGVIFAGQRVNALQAVGAASLSAPQFQAIGGDADIDIRLTPKGAGLVDLLPATIALGGGAAPTLGTIGGTGPAAAAQFAWAKVKINGVAGFIPIWH